MQYTQSVHTAVLVIKHYWFTGVYMYSTPNNLASFPGFYTQSFAVQKRQMLPWKTGNETNCHCAVIIVGWTVLRWVNPAGV